MRSDVTTRVQKHRAMLRNSGMRPIQIWIPDTRSERFVEECHRQAILAAKADLEDVEQASLLDAIMLDLIEKDF